MPNQTKEGFLYGIIGALIICICIFIYTTVAYQFRPTYAPEDLNRDGVVDLKDFSIALYLLNNITDELQNN